MVSLIILVFIETQDPGNLLPEVLERAAEQALGSRASVSVRAIQPATPDALLLSQGHEQGAWAVARVTWRDPRRLEARLDVTLLEDGRKLSEPLTFERSDPSVERWRALGLVLASTLNKDAEAHGGALSPEALPLSELSAARRSPPPEPAQRWALDAAVEGGIAIGGTGAVAGGSLGLRWLRFSRVGFRLGMRARFGEMAEAQAAIVTVAGAAGVVLDALTPRADRHLGFALRADALLLYETMAHLSPDDAARVRQSRLLPGVSVAAELRWSLSPTLALLLAAGPEVAWGTTRVYVGDTEVGHLSPLRAAVQAGLVASF